MYSIRYVFHITASSITNLDSYVFCVLDVVRNFLSLGFILLANTSQAYETLKLLFVLCRRVFLKGDRNWESVGLSTLYFYSN